MGREYNEGPRFARRERVGVAIFGVVAGRECVFSVIPDADRVVSARQARSPLAHTGSAPAGRLGVSRPARRGPRCCVVADCAAAGAKVEAQPS